MTTKDAKAKTQGRPAPRKGSAPDFSLIVARMEKQLLAGQNTLACGRILARQDLWRSLELDLQLKWARLAQMAGDMQTALKVYALINATTPELALAWEERLELLFILNRTEQLAQLLAKAKTVLDGKAHESLLKKFGARLSSALDDDMGRAARPFQQLRHRQEIIARFLDLFSGRHDYFARQWANKAEQRQGYVPVRRPMEPADVEEHLRGRKTYGIYLLKEDATVSVAVIDADLAKKFRKAKFTADEKSLIRRERLYLFSRIKEISAGMGLSPVIEYSGGKGYHFWFFFDAPVRAGLARIALKRISESVSKDVSAFQLEIFPKQDRLSGKGFGNLVKLPLGIHRATGKRSGFVECHHRSVEAQLDFVSCIKPSKAQGLVAAKKTVEQDKVSVHPRWQQWADEYPELYRLETLCPPLGHVIAACRNGATMSGREAKVILQTIGFLPRAKTLLHYLSAFTPDYNPHMVDYKLSCLRGTPLGCKRIHSLLGFQADMCTFKRTGDYAHPLLHLDAWNDDESAKAEKVENLSDAIGNLKVAIVQVERFLR